MKVKLNKRNVSFMKETLPFMKFGKKGNKIVKKILKKLK